MAEAFYQSVSGPYELLIVGDPLCQPWARFPKVQLKGNETFDPVKGTISITPSGTVPGGGSIGSFEVFVDGRLVAQNAPGNTLEIDTTKLADGFHELRIVGAVANAIETQGRIILPIHVQNHDAKLEIKVAPFRAKANGTFRVSVLQSGATAIKIRQNSRELGHVEGEAGEIEISAATLGRGFTKLQAFSEGPLPVVSEPLGVQVE